MTESWTALFIEILWKSALVSGGEVETYSLLSLKQLGVCIEIDDFGTGYSSLSYLGKFPIDALKIDQSFIRDTLTDDSNAAIVKTIISLGQTLGLSVIAEGVETREQVAFLRRHGCALRHSGGAAAGRDQVHLSGHRVEHRGHPRRLDGDGRRAGAAGRP